MSEKYLILNKGREVSIERKHPWVFSGAVKKIATGVTDGDIVEIHDFSGNIIAKAHYQGGASIVGRILAFHDVPIDQQFWKIRLQEALEFRQQILALPNNETNAFRLIHGEGDGLPGLIIDIYHDVAVIQCHSLGMYKSLPEIVVAIQNLEKISIKAIYNKSKETMHGSQNNEMSDSILFGNSIENISVVENGNKFIVNYEDGQKTGFFLDQRDNRAMVGKMSKGKTVLNCFSYTGGFSIYALNGGASSVTSIDVSAKAMDICDKNVMLTPYAERHSSLTANVMEYLKEDDDKSYDIVIVDPPAFAKSVTKRHNAVQAYKRLNALAIKKVKPGGLLFTFSCSQVVNTQLFYDTIVSAGLESNRNAKVLHHLSQGADHPVHLFHPEGHYLKGLLLQIV